MVTFVSQQKPTTRRVQPAPIPGVMGLTECHEGQGRIVFSIRLILPTLLVPPSVPSRFCPAQTACRAVWLPAAARSWHQSWHRNVNCPRAVSDSAPTSQHEPKHCEQNHDARHLQVTVDIHAVVQNSDNGNAVACWAEIDNVLFHAAPPVTWPNVGATLRLLWGFGQVGAGRFDEVGVAQGLRQAPLHDGVVKNPVKIALRSWAETAFSHTAPSCAV